MNQYSSDEIEHLLHKLGANGVRLHSTSIRSTCPCHGGSNPMAFAAWMDAEGNWVFTCHSHGCVKKAAPEWVCRRVLQGSIESAVEWIGAALGRTDLVVSTGNRHRELQIQDEPNPEIAFSGNQEELTRLQGVHPYHAYWRDRGYTPEMVNQFGLTYRSLDYRALIPLYTADRKLLGTMERSTNGEEPKYRWNSPNPHKSSFLFGVPQALENPIQVGSRRVVFVVEGTLDGVKATSLGFPVVSTQTNRLSGAQAQTLIRNWDLAIVIPDNDTAGQSLVLDFSKRCSPFIDTAVFTIREQFKDLDNVPITQVGTLLAESLHAWKTRFASSNRHQRAALLTL